jgi:hypothetical protein
VSEPDPLKRKKRQLELKFERALWRLGYELYLMWRQPERLRYRWPNKELCIAPESAAGQLMLEEIPEVTLKLSRVVADIEGMDYLQALMKVHSWERPLLDKLVEPGFRRLEGVEVRVVGAEYAMVDAWAAEDN